MPEKRKFICEYCNYSTPSNSYMEKHKNTARHKLNSQKPDIMDGLKRIKEENEKEMKKKLNIDDFDVFDHEYYTDMDKLFNGCPIGEYEKLVMHSQETLKNLEKKYKELPNDNIWAMIQCKMMLNMVRNSHKEMVDNYCKRRLDMVKESGDISKENLSKANN